MDKFLKKIYMYISKIASQFEHSKLFLFTTFLEVKHNCQSPVNVDKKSKTSTFDDSHNRIFLSFTANKLSFIPEDDVQNVLQKPRCNLENSWCYQN